MMKKNRFLLLALGVACATTAFADMKEERLSRAYQNAMADYTAGRLGAATSGFEKAVKENGENASARFQLACLQQDFGKNYLGAVCNYREYLRLEPSSDKASLARDRLALCERELAKELAAKYNLGGGPETIREMEETQNRLKETEKKLAQAVKDAEDLTKKAAALERENMRLRRQVKSVGAEEEPSNKALSAVRALLEEEEAPRHARATPGVEEDDTDAKPFLKNLAEANDTEESVGPRKLKVDESARALADDDSNPRPVVKPDIEEDDGMKSLRSGLAAAKELVEEDESGPELLDKNQKPAEKKLTEMANPFWGGANHQADDQSFRPKTYVVQEGDSLYRIARRFYGRDSAWKKIRDANKATISTDGRVNAGQTIILP